MFVLINFKKMCPSCC
jgi:hypothetical protein